MPNVGEDYQITEQPPLRTTVLDPSKRKYRDQTRVIEGSAEITVRKLRRITIETHIVRREPIPTLNAALPAVTFNNGCRELFENLIQTSINQEQHRLKDSFWLNKINLQRYSQAFPSGLQAHKYLLGYHLHALYITGLIDNLGTEASLSLQLIEYLESTRSGRIYLLTINADHILRRYYRHRSHAERQEHLIGRIWTCIRERAEEGDPPGRSATGEYLYYWNQYCFECVSGTAYGNNYCHCSHNNHVNQDAFETDTEVEDSDIEDSDTETDTVPDQTSSLFPHDPENFIAPPSQPTAGSRTKQE